MEEPKLHTQRITLTRTSADDPGGERLILDFHGTSPQAKGPINHCGDYADGNFLKKWLAPILRNLVPAQLLMGRSSFNNGQSISAGLPQFARGRIKAIAGIIEQER